MLDKLNMLKGYAELEKSIKQIIKLWNSNLNIRITDTSTNASKLLDLYFNTYDKASQFLEMYGLVNGIVYNDGEISEDFDSAGELNITFKKDKNTIYVQHEETPVENARVWMNIFKGDERHIIKFESNHNGEYIAENIPAYTKAIIYARWENKENILRGAKKITEVSNVGLVESPVPIPIDVDLKHIESVKKTAEIRNLLSINDTIDLLFNVNTPRKYIRGVFKKVGDLYDEFVSVNNSETLVNINKTTNKLKQIAIPQYLRDYNPSKIKKDLKKISSYESISDNDLEIIANSIQNKLQEEPDGIICKEKLDCIMELLRESEYGILKLDKVHSELINKFKINKEYANQTINAIRSFEEYDDVIVCKSDYILSKWQVENFISKQHQEGISNKDICKSYSDYLDFIPPELIEILKNNGIECNR